MKIQSLNLLLIIICYFSTLSCNKKDPNPELLDPVYLDLKQEFELSIKQLADIEKQVAKDTLIYNKTQPQEGLYNVNRNKMSMSENLLSVVRQQKKFFEIKLEQRKAYVNQRYIESLKGGRPWPDEKELADYKIRMKLQREKFEADVRNVPRGTSDKGSPSKAAAAKKEPEKAPSAKTEH